MAEEDVDPFAAMGGGVKRNGGWIPRNMLSSDELAQYDQQQAGGGTPAPPPTTTAPTTPSPPTAPTTSSDPFAAMGGGIQVNGGWIPRNMATADQIAAWEGGGAMPSTSSPPTPPAPTTPTAPPTSTPDPFEAMGGGIQVNGGWIPRNMATSDQIRAWESQQSSTTTGGVPGGAPPNMGPTPPGTTPAAEIPRQSENSQVYSQTPAAPTAPYSANQGTQDVIRNTWLERAVQPKTIDANDPAIRAQVDPFAAAQDRARRQYLSEAAERASTRGLGDSGALDLERRYASERAGQATGLFESQLVGKELQNRRDEINDALSNLAGLVKGDQSGQLAREEFALQKELAELDAALKRLGIETGAATAESELGLKRELGLGGLNVDLMRLLQADRQFADTMGFNVGDREAYWNNQALQNMMSLAR